MDEVEHKRYKATSKEFNIVMACENISCRDGLKLLSGFSATSQDDGSFEIIATWSTCTGEFSITEYFNYHPVISDEFFKFYNSLKWVKIEASK